MTDRANEVSIINVSFKLPSIIRYSKKHFSKFQKVIMDPVTLAALSAYVVFATQAFNAGMDAVDRLNAVSELKRT